MFYRLVEILIRLPYSFIIGLQLIVSILSVHDQEKLLQNNLSNDEGFNYLIITWSNLLLQLHAGLR